MEVGILDLWLPILVSAIAVFFASFLFWMVVGHHKNDWKQLPDEDAVMDLLRGQNITAGMYMWPHCGDPNAMSDDLKAKYEAGPSGMMTILRPGSFTMGRSLAKWFIYSVFVGIATAYVCTRGSLGVAGAEFLDVFQIAGCVSFLCYSCATIPNSIWKGHPAPHTIKEVVDGLAYGLLTGAAFGMLWPSA